jgi:hypothetical protein
MYIYIYIYTHTLSLSFVLVLNDQHTYIPTHKNTHKQYTISFSMTNTMKAAGARYMVRPEIHRNASVRPHSDSESDNGNNLRRDSESGYMVQYGASFLVRNVCPIPSMVCLCMYVCVCMYIFVCASVYVCMYVCAYAARRHDPLVHVCTYVLAYIHTYIHTHIHTYIHACLNTYTHTHTYIHTYTHTTYIHTYIHTRNLRKVYTPLFLQPRT